MASTLALPPPPALMRCRRPGSLERFAARNDDPEQAWGFDVRVSAESIELVSGTPASVARARGQRPALPRTIAALIPLLVGSVQSTFMFIGGIRGLSSVTPIAAGLFTSLLILAFILPWRDRGKLGVTQRPILRADLASRTLHVVCSGATIRLDEVRGVQLLHGVVDTPTGNFDLRQLVMLAATDASPPQWRRYLAHVDFCSFIEDHNRAAIAFGEAFSPPLAAEVYRIRGWRTPESYIFRPDRAIRVRSADTPTQPEAAEPEPLGDGVTLDVWRAAGFTNFDSIPERVLINACKPMCLCCFYSLEGLCDPKTCPECGADFVANPMLRA